MSLDLERISEICDGFSRARVAVIGDFMADVYLDARPDRLSREAPVMVVTWKGERLIPGGAANAVNNLVALGARVHPLGVLGGDASGHRLLEFFGERTESVEGLVVRDDLDTVTKTRVMVGAENRTSQQILRIDREPRVRPDAAAVEQLRERVRNTLPAVDAVILSDYGYGLVDEGLVRLVLDLAGDRLVTGDSRHHLRRMRGVTAAKPNHIEAAELVGHPVFTDEEAERAGRRLREELDVRALLLTRGNRGMMLLQENEEPVFIAAAELPGEVTDVSGAGDTVVGLFTLARVAGASWREAAELANIGAGVVVGKLGAATVGPEELLRAARRLL